ncbi:hypothetical protein BXA15_06630 [Campylobacter lari]|uniref:hypothetical protein n=1 Tax=Campylobacter TaxID=194 RepID=UPI001859CAB3|nr:MULTISPECIES: hypothetical protein [Campylobacter]EAI3897242.1 hypothetical protein [Campylobacter lari]EAJ5697140.1 hypothetical protein [Campylobacter lari]EHC7929205.1 hypothetical protein [Campylobacter lari]MCR2079414.1 hypothetical protein [Campylobacter lari subsp. concheus]MCV3424512.1 hypothetical protein [Campylobacter sp. IFREMER_LSEM_CL1085]
MKKDNELEKIGLKDFNSILYARELKYNKINKIYRTENCEIFTKNKDVKSCFKLEVDQIVLESGGIKIKEVDMKKINYEDFAYLQTILEKKERIVYVYKENNNIIYSPRENENYFIKKEIQNNEKYF